MDKYKPGTIVEAGGVRGKVVKNYKLPGDVCIKWANGLKCSYDVDWLDENVQIIKDK